MELILSLITVPHEHLLLPTGPQPPERFSSVSR